MSQRPVRCHKTRNAGPGWHNREWWGLVNRQARSLPKSSVCDWAQPITPIWGCGPPASRATKVSRELKVWIFIGNFPTFKCQQLMYNYFKLRGGLSFDVTLISVSLIATKNGILPGETLSANKQELQRNGLWSKIKKHLKIILLQGRIPCSEGQAAHFTYEQDSFSAGTVQGRSRLQRSAMLDFESKPLSLSAQAGPTFAGSAAQPAASCTQHTRLLPVNIGCYQMSFPEKNVSKTIYHYTSCIGGLTFPELT